MILAQTVKGWTLGPGVEARNITHQAKKLNEQELRDLPRPAGAAHPGREAQGRALLPARPTTRPEIQYLMERRARARRSAAAPRGASSKTLELPGDKVYGEFMTGSGTQEVSTTMAFAKLLRNLLRDKGIGERDRAHHPGRGAHLRHGPALQGGRHLLGAGPALRPGRLEPGAVATARRRTARCSRRASRRPAHRLRSRPRARPTPPTPSR